MLNDKIKKLTREKKKTQSIKYERRKKNEGVKLKRKKKLS
jgi:hypothetical protein